MAVNTGSIIGGNTKLRAGDQVIFLMAWQNTFLHTLNFATVQRAASNVAANLDFVQLRGAEFVGDTIALHITVRASAIVTGTNFTAQVAADEILTIMQREVAPDANLSAVSFFREPGIGDIAGGLFGSIDWGHPAVLGGLAVVVGFIIFAFSKKVR